MNTHDPMHPWHSLKDTPTLKASMDHFMGMLKSKIHAVNDSDITPTFFVYYDRTLCVMPVDEIEDPYRKMLMKTSMQMVANYTHPSGIVFASAADITPTGVPNPTGIVIPPPGEYIVLHGESATERRTMLLPVARVGDEVQLGEVIEYDSNDSLRVGGDMTGFFQLPQMMPPGPYAEQVANHVSQLTTMLMSGLIPKLTECKWTHIDPGFMAAWQADNERSGGKLLEAGLTSVVFDSNQHRTLH